MPPSSHPAFATPAASGHAAPVVPAAEEQRRRRRRWLLLLLLLLSAVPSILTTSISISMFADRSLAPSDAVAAVEVDVKADPPVLVVAGGMLPGDAVTGTLDIQNRGDLPIRYSVTITTSHRGVERLSDALVAEVRSEGSGCATFDGALLYRGPLSATHVGDPAHGGDPGDRALDSGRGEVLCLAITLPDLAGDRYQASSATAAFTVTAEEDR